MWSIDLKAVYETEYYMVATRALSDPASKIELARTKLESRYPRRFVVEQTWDRRDKGFVHKATDRTNGSDFVAIRQVFSSPVHISGPVRAAKREFKIAKQLFSEDGPLSNDDRFPEYLEMDLDYDNTLHLIRKWRERKTLHELGKLNDINQINSLFFQVLEIVGSLHKLGYVLVDSKRSNFVVEETNGSLGKVRLSEVEGIMHKDERPFGGDASSVVTVWTPGSSDPKSLTGVVDIRLDFYSLGSILAGLFLGDTLEFDADSSQIVNLHQVISEQHRLVIGRAMHPGLYSRFQSVEEMAHALRGAALIPFVSQPSSFAIALEALWHSLTRKRYALPFARNLIPISLLSQAIAEARIKIGRIASWNGRQSTLAEKAFAGYSSKQAQFKLCSKGIKSVIAQEVLARKINESEHAEAALLSGNPCQSVERILGEVIDNSRAAKRLLLSGSVTDSQARKILAGRILNPEHTKELISSCKCSDVETILATFLEDVQIAFDLLSTGLILHKESEEVLTTRIKAPNDIRDLFLSGKITSSKAQKTLASSLASAAYAKEILTFYESKPITYPDLCFDAEKILLQTVGIISPKEAPKK